MSMMFSLVVFLLVRVSFVSRTIFGIVSYLITSITSELSFLVGVVLTLRMMMVIMVDPFWVSWIELLELNLHFPYFLLETLSMILLVSILPIVC